MNICVKSYKLKNYYQDKITKQLFIKRAISIKNILK